MPNTQNDVQGLWKMHNDILEQEDGLTQDDIETKAVFHKLRLRIRSKIHELTAKENAQ